MKTPQVPALPGMTPLGINPNPRTVRQFSACGPCIPQGKLVRETAKFYVVRDSERGDGREFKLMKRTAERYSPNHVEPCPSCQDHAKTQYPNGYMD
jgi:hypothetical protein